VRPDTRVYKDKTFHRAAHMNQKYKLDHWGCFVVRGEDRYGLNKLVQGPAAPEQDPA
jgi:hypothetical protein